jgi:hypothetical protein
MLGKAAGGFAAGQTGCATVQCGMEFRCWQGPVGIQRFIGHETIPLMALITGQWAKCIDFSTVVVCCRFELLLRKRAASSIRMLEKVMPLFYCAGGLLLMDFGSVSFTVRPVPRCVYGFL